MKNVENTIERQIEIKAPIAKVWNAIADYKLFGQWFGVDFQSKFAAGKITQAKKMMKDCAMDLDFHIREIKPQHYFSYAWRPYPIDKNFDYSKEEPTLVEFFLEEIASGTLLKVKESGFNKITASRRAEAFKRHSEGWETQVKNVQKFVEKTK